MEFWNLKQAVNGKGLKRNWTKHAHHKILLVRLEVDNKTLKESIFFLINHYYTYVVGSQSEKESSNSYLSNSSWLSDKIVPRIGKARHDLINLTLFVNFWCNIANFKLELNDKIDYYVLTNIIKLSRSFEVLLVVMVIILIKSRCLLYYVFFCDTITYMFIINWW